MNTNTSAIINVGAKLLAIVYIAIFWAHIPKNRIAVTLNSSI